MDVVVHARLVRHGKQQRICLGDRLASPQLLYQRIRLGCIAASEDRARLFVYEADRVGRLALLSEIGAIAIVHQCEDAAAHGNTPIPSVARLLPRLAKGANLFSLLDMERAAVLI